jgi:hypothetical protein
VCAGSCLSCQVYIIPQDQGEAPLEVKSLAPNQRGSRQNLIAEIPGRSLKRPRRALDITEKAVSLWPQKVTPRRKPDVT